MFEAASPWRTVAYEDHWLGIGGRAQVMVEMPSPWLSAAGDSAWATFSCNGDSSCSVYRDRFNLTRAKLTLAPDGPPDHSPADKEMVDQRDWSLTFRDEFDTLRLWGDPGGVWKTSYIWGDVRINNELQHYADPRRPGVNPFTIKDGILSITARPTELSLLPKLDNRPYTSGLLTTEKSFGQEYGYFEIRAQVPKGRGLWPAFWMLPSFNSWPEGVAVLPEIDVLEVLGHETTVLHNTAHTNETGSLTSESFHSNVGDLASGFHTYGVIWQPDRISWYLDGRRTATTRTPSDIHGPFHLLMNLAVGGNWPGNPDATTDFPAAYKIDYVRAYAPARP